MPAEQREIIELLRKEILCLEGLKPSLDNGCSRFGLGPLEAALPNQTFPTGVIHEFLSAAMEDAAATSGFVAGLIGRLTGREGRCLWISTHRTLFPPALKAFGIEPHHFIFIDLYREQDALWAIEEALKCEALTAVVGELREISFAQSRRLQLAVEQSRVTGFIHRLYPRSIKPTACVSRWQITSLPSETEGTMPGVGFPRWKVQLLRIRNGRPGTWSLEWSGNRFHSIEAYAPVVIPFMQQTG